MFLSSILVQPELPLVLKSISNQEILSGEFLPGNGVGRGNFLSCGVNLYSLLAAAGNTRNDTTPSLGTSKLVR